MGDTGVVVAVGRGVRFTTCFLAAFETSIFGGVALIGVFKSTISIGSGSVYTHISLALGAPNGTFSTSCIESSSNIDDNLYF